MRRFLVNSSIVGLFFTLLVSTAIAQIQKIEAIKLVEQAQVEQAQVEQTQVEQTADAPIPDDAQATAKERKQLTSQLDRTISVLKDYGLTATRESISGYLRDICPNEESQAIVDRLATKLGSPTFAEREAATQEMIRLPTLTEGQLRAVNSSDPEVVYRLRLVLEARHDSGTTLQSAVFRFIELLPLPGLTERIIQAYPHLASDSVRRAARLALVANCQPEETDLLRGLLHHADPGLQLVAAEGLHKLLGESVLAELKPLLESPDAQLRLQIAIIYAKAGSPDCLDQFLHLLNSDEPQVVSMAHAMLSKLTGQQIRFSGRDKPDERERSIAQWREWIDAHRSEVTIEYRAVTPKFNRILLSRYDHSIVVELDMDRKELWRAPMPNAFACEGLPNGHRLVAMYSHGTVVEFDADGKEFKRFAGLPSSISGVKRLENGNTLIAAGQTDNTLMEIDQDGKEVWQRKMNGTPVHLNSLQNGNILVTFKTNSQIAEIDREGKVQWEFKVDAAPYSATQLETGDFLVASTDGKIFEYDPDGNKTFELTTGTNTYSVEKLESGDYLYADTNGLHLVSPTGKAIWDDEAFRSVSYLDHY